MRSKLCHKERIKQKHNLCDTFLSFCWGFKHLARMYAYFLELRSRTRDIARLETNGVGKREVIKFEQNKVYKIYYNRVGSRQSSGIYSIKMWQWGWGLELVAAKACRWLGGTTQIGSVVHLNFN